MKKFAVMIAAVATTLAISSGAAAQEKMATYQLVMLKKGPNAATAQTRDGRPDGEGRPPRRGAASLAGPRGGAAEVGRRPAASARG